MKYICHHTLWNCYFKLFKRDFTINAWVMINQSCWRILKSSPSLLTVHLLKLEDFRMENLHWRSLISCSGRTRLGFKMCLLCTLEELSGFFSWFSAQLEFFLSSFQPHIFGGRFEMAHEKLQELLRFVVSSHCTAKTNKQTNTKCCRSSQKNVIWYDRQQCHMKMYWSDPRPYMSLIVDMNDIVIVLFAFVCVFFASL